jgi:multidrug efflux pump subunit AcrA (membrane-fusion protein)
LQLNAVTLARWKVLYRDSTVTKQELDTYQSDYDASVASVAAADANVSRLGALVGYERIIAPFDGVVTARNVDDGVFVTAAGTTNTPVPAGQGGNTLIGTNSTTELFRIASTDTIRVYLGVPQSYAPAVRVGLPAVLAVSELPQRAFPGRITRTASAVDASSLTLLTEVDVTNNDRSLLPGMFAQAHFRFERSNPPILMPGTAMIFRTSAAQAAVVGSDSLVHFHTLKIGRDFGTVIEADSGLADGDYVVAQPSDDLRDGQPVHARIETQDGAPGGDTRAGRPVAAPPPASQSQRGQRGGERPSASPAQPGQSGTTGQGPAAASTYKPPPQLEEGFPGAPPPPRH